MGIDSTSSIQNHDISTQKTIDQSEKTSLVSSASIQFNSIHDRLVEAWQRFLEECSGVLYFLSTAGHVEDYMNVNYLRDTAIQAGARTEYLAIEELGFDERLEQFVDAQNQAIMSAFKLYPWEWMLDEAYGKHLVYTKIKWLEPPWKILLSNKAIMTVLWELYPESPYLLETSMSPIVGDHVRKPCQSREGQGVEISVGGNVLADLFGRGKAADRRDATERFTRGLFCLLSLCAHAAQDHDQSEKAVTHSRCLRHHTSAIAQPAASIWRR